jgi:hypothetical protein
MTHGTRSHEDILAELAFLARHLPPEDQARIEHTMRLIIEMRQAVTRAQLLAEESEWRLAQAEAITCEKTRSGPNERALTMDPWVWKSSNRSSPFNSELHHHQRTLPVFVNNLAWLISYR